MTTKDELMALKAALLNAEYQIATRIRSLRLKAAEVQGRTIRVFHDTGRPVVLVTTDNRFFAIGSDRYDDYSLDLEPDVHWKTLYSLNVLTDDDTKHLRDLCDKIAATQERLQYETQIAAVICKAKKSPELWQSLQALLVDPYDSDQSESD